MIDDGKSIEYKEATDEELFTVSSLPSTTNINDLIVDLEGKTVTVKGTALVNGVEISSGDFTLAVEDNSKPSATITWNIEEKVAKCSVEYSSGYIIEDGIVKSVEEIANREVFSLAVGQCRRV